MRAGSSKFGLPWPTAAFACLSPTMVWVLSPIGSKAAAVQRQFHLTERAGLRFRSESFNLFDHPNFGHPSNNLSDPFLGHSTQTLASSLGSSGAKGGFSRLYPIGGPRSVQFALKAPILTGERSF